MDFENNKLQLVLFVSGLIILSFSAEKCRQLVGEEASSQSGKFTFLNCFDGSTGTMACAVKEGVKLYVYTIRSSHVERARRKAIEATLVDALSQGLSAKDAALQAQQEGKKAAKLATRQAKRIIGPVISSGWDFFEAVYYGGTMTEGLLRGTGTLFGTYAIGYLGEQKFGRVGYLLGSHLGSWVGGRVGLMVYDVVNGVSILLEFTETVETISSDGASESEAKEYVTSVLETVQPHEGRNILIDIIFKIVSQIFPGTPSDSNEYQTSGTESSEPSEDSYGYETPTYMSSETPEDTNYYESTTYENPEMHEEL
ncbi:Nicotianamine synthase6 [Heracleum sosnowskyi]|uniref:Nicotianamine synthase6 n=1 Tax=Heracleum sosnowskyi TaxID=360622 RepID=A0AAD8HD98_9APIA|nr:Nicotianamine synthase6 [Heracleum sosnowskyi]